ncbi:MAG: nitrile hydratase accessory protein [Salinisphaera sp.]|nr:nitrile hydratase accessory protein [Salinisphaera sp.]
MTGDPLLELEQSLQDMDGPAFDHPWQVQAFALVVSMHKAGLFAWPQWVETFSREVDANPAAPGETVNDAYYRQWLAALDALVAALGIAGEEDVSARAQQWKKAYLNTPHGRPITLDNARCPPADQHEAERQPGPVAVKAATG